VRVLQSYPKLWPNPTCEECSFILNFNSYFPVGCRRGAVAYTNIVDRLFKSMFFDNNNMRFENYSFRRSKRCKLRWSSSVDCRTNAIFGASGVTHIFMTVSIISKNCVALIVHNIMFVDPAKTWLWQRGQYKAYLL